MPPRRAEDCWIILVSYTTCRLQHRIKLTWNEFGRGGGFKAQSKLRKCSRGGKAFCCEANDWKNLVRGCEWTKWYVNFHANQSKFSQKSADYFLKWFILPTWDEVFAFGQELFISQDKYVVPLDSRIALSDILLINGV